MSDYMCKLFDTTDFPPRWHCGHWTSLHGWAHIISDLGIFLAYMSIPIILIYFSKRKKDLPFPRIFYLFAAFIFFCGTTHLNEAIIFWYPIYRWAALIKLCTALVSLATVVALMKVIPQALSLKTPKELEMKVQERTTQLKQSNEELEQFAYVVSHDLKAPLRGIGSLVDWLAKDYAGKFDENGKEQIKLIIGRTKRMHDMIDDILEYSKIGQIEFKKVEVNLNELLKEVIALVEIPKNIKVTLGDLPEIKAEKATIQQIFINLVDNAVKYSNKPDGKIRISCTNDKTSWRFSVSDNGIGIEEQHYERIFKMFQTLQSKDEGGGTGIGLAIVKKIVELYKGKIWVESKAGEGSTFFFTIPK